MWWRERKKYTNDHLVKQQISVLNWSVLKWKNGWSWQSLSCTTVSVLRWITSYWVLWINTDLIILLLSYLIGLFLTLSSKVKLITSVIKWLRPDTTSKHGHFACNWHFSVLKIYFSSITFIFSQYVNTLSVLYMITNFPISFYRLQAY